MPQQPIPPTDLPDDRKPPVQEPPKTQDEGDLPPPNRDIQEPERDPKRIAGEPSTEKASFKAIVNETLGLPPGDGTPRGKGRPVRDVPHGALTSADREPNRPAAREHEQ